MVLLRSLTGGLGADSWCLHGSCDGIFSAFGSYINILGAFVGSCRCSLDLLLIFLWASLGPPRDWFGVEAAAARGVGPGICHPLDARAPDRAVS
jgi:hypothetical protein